VPGLWSKGLLLPAARKRAKSFPDFCLRVSAGEAHESLEVSQAFLNLLQA